MKWVRSQSPSSTCSVGILTCVIVFFSTEKNALAAPTDFAFNRIPSRFETSELTVGSRALGEICLSRDIFPDGTVCNPAYLHEAKDSSLLLRAYLGNGYSALSTANNLIFKPISKEFLQELFKNQNTTSLEANFGLVFTTKNFSASFAPYRIQYVSEVHNPNFPVVAIHAAVERSFQFAYGTDLGQIFEEWKDFSAGTKLRILTRNYVHGSFSLFQVLGQDPKELLPSKSQKALFFDPSLAYTPSQAPWKLRMSVGAKNLGSSWPSDALYPEKPDLQAGVGIEPPLHYGRFRVGLDFVDLVHAQDLESRFRLGGSYQLGIMEAMLGTTSNALTAGMQFGLQVIQVGIVYEFIRADLAGNAPENRISTEVAIRL